MTSSARCRPRRRESEGEACSGVRDTVRRPMGTEVLIVQTTGNGMGWPQREIQYGECNNAVYVPWGKG